MSSVWQFQNWAGKATTELSSINTRAERKEPTYVQNSTLTAEIEVLLFSATRLLNTTYHSVARVLQVFRFHHTHTSTVVTAERAQSTNPAGYHCVSTHLQSPRVNGEGLLAFFVNPARQKAAASLFPCCSSAGAAQLAGLRTPQNALWKADAESTEARKQRRLLSERSADALSFSSFVTPQSIHPVLPTHGQRLTDGCTFPLVFDPRRQVFLSLGG